MRRMRLLVLISILLLVFAAACGGETTAGGGSGGGDDNVGQAGKEGDDLLAVVKEKGVLTASTDVAYPPQSSRTPDGGLEGFDIDVTKEIAKRLGVDVKFITPSFNAIIAGSWSGRWDISVGSVTISPERQKVLHFSPVYYYTPASVAVHQENSDIQDEGSDLDGKKIGVCAACSYDLYLQDKLVILGKKYQSVVSDPQIERYETDSVAIQDLALGDGVRLDAAISALPTFQLAIDEGTPIKVVGDALFLEPLGVAIDRASPEDPKAFAEEVSRIIEEMHADGTLSELSKKWYKGVDLSKKKTALAAG